MSKKIKNIYMKFLKCLVLYELLETKHQDIPFEADLGEPGTPYIDEVSIPRGKTLDVIHGADPTWPADRNPKFSARRGNSSMKRKELCDRIFQQSINSVHGDNLTSAAMEEPPVLRYSEYRALPSAGAPDFADENASSGFEE